ncbi:YopX family protein [Bacillus inaquosorum]|uniref:YopX family protein n=1 Tax=Bacillus inaquosorum TaxID=483913 RepID=UPI00227E20A6|nr:YopX family protein [Bacillus inaquosorum]MCY8073356.1 YopX family protein [Bacillus inaquosorum]MCY9380815.1 YopX family protein [Bacillus inaquosorum]
MNTAYRVWDGRQMHYWNDKGVKLVFQDNGRWSLWQGYGDRCVASSNDGKSVLMWGTDQVEICNHQVVSVYKGDVIQQEETELGSPYGPGIFIGEVKMIEGQWCIVNEKKKEARPLFAETATNKILGDVFQNPELLEGAE